MMGRDVILQVMVSREEREAIARASDMAKTRGSSSLSAYCREAILTRVASDKTVYGNDFDMKERR